VSQVRIVKRKARPAVDVEPALLGEGDVRLLLGSTADRIREIADGSIDLLVTSPPFLAQREYLAADDPRKTEELGGEATPAGFLTGMLALTDEWGRVLAAHGSICVEIGDTYSSGGAQASAGWERGKPAHTSTPGRLRGAQGGGRAAGDRSRWPQAKSLCMLPTLYAASLAYGRNVLTGKPCGQWIVRNVVVWSRPNPGVGALGDKHRPSTSYMTVATRAPDRYFDQEAIRAPYKQPQVIGTRRGGTSDARTFYPDDVRAGWTNHPDLMIEDRGGRPQYDHWQPSVDERATWDWWAEEIWEMSTSAYKGAHFATYPPGLPSRCVRSMAPERVCTTCGEPSRRVVDHHRAFNREAAPGARSRTPEARQGGPLVDKSEVSVSVSTVGWTDCGHGTWRRGMVLDPFAGTGTTLAVAARLGRDAVGIELDPACERLVRERVTGTIVVV
jgi:site-specific DNA-methyltransferase (adenine-specific)